MVNGQPFNRRKWLTISGAIGAIAAIIILLSCAYATAGSLW